MRREYSARLRKEFDSSLKELMPCFSIVKDENHTAKSSPLYRCVVADDFFMYIYLDIANTFNQFRVEVAWSTEQKIPKWEPFINPQDDAHGQGIRVCLSRFWKIKGDYWWVIEPRDTPQEAIRRVKEFDMSLPPVSQFLPNVTTNVQEVMQKLREYGLPYLVKVASEHGHEMDFNIK